MVYKAFIYEKEQSYTVCRKCMSNNTRLQKKILCALQPLNKRTRWKPNNTNTIQMT